MPQNERTSDPYFVTRALNLDHQNVFIKRNNIKNSHV